MSSATINRSLNSIRNELEFLRESDVISEEAYNKILQNLPEKYDPNRSQNTRSQDNLSVASSHAPPPPPSNNNNSEYCEALYAFKPQQQGDLELRAGDKVEILEKTSPEWYKGKCNGSVGMFPSNYVKMIFSGANNSSQQHFAPPPSAPPYEQQMQQNSAYLQPMPVQQQQNTGYSQQSNYSQQPPFPPPSANYYPQQQQPVPIVEQQQQPQQDSQLKKFGSKLGNAAIFGAGATLGGDLVNSIF